MPAREDPPIPPIPPIEQACVILNSSKSKEPGRESLSFFKTSAVADLLRSDILEVQSGSTKLELG